MGRSLDSFSDKVHILRKVYNDGSVLELKVTTNEFVLKSKDVTRRDGVLEVEHDTILSLEKLRDFEDVTDSKENVSESEMDKFFKEGVIKAVLAIE